MNASIIRSLRMAVAVAFVSGAAAPVSGSAAVPETAQGGYLFATFKSGTTPMAEQIYLGLSPDGYHWDALNNADPVLVSAIGEKGVRDPYLLRAHDGGKFYLLATDLSMSFNRDWRRATHAGSKSIVIWESDDLVKWSAPRLVKVAPDDAGCTWAPEAIYDEQTKDYLVYWASTTARDNFAKQRIWSAHTTDFKTFTPSEIYIEKPKNVIDTDIIREDGKAGAKYYRFTKDDRNKDITLEVADQLAGPWTDVAGYSLAAMQGYEGPAAFRLNAGADGPAGGARWCLLLDYYTKGQGYEAFTTSDLASGKFTPSDEMKFPFAFRHGSVLPLTGEEYQRVKSAYASAAASQ